MDFPANNRSHAEIRPLITRVTAELQRARGRTSPPAGHLPLLWRELSRRASANRGEAEALDE
jgi:hypothetical protein